MKVFFIFFFGMQSFKTKCLSLVSVSVLALYRECVGVPEKKKFSCATMKELEQRNSYEIIQERLLPPRTHPLIFTWLFSAL